MSILTLHKPNEQHIETLYDVLHLKRIRKYTGVNELSFELPSKIQDSKTLEYIDNPDLKLIKYDYLIKHDNLWYIIKQINKKQEDGVEYYSITCFGRVYQVKQKRLRKFKTGTPENPVKNLTNTANLILSGTVYSLGNVDVSLDLKYRAIEIRSNALDGLNKLAEAWDCAWIADEENKLIHFVDYKTDGGFLGIYITENNYLKNINLDMREDSIITRLHIYGKNDISVHAVNTGKDYIDDFSFYKNTDYMSQDLIDALNTYENAIVNSHTQYTTYLTNKNTLQSSLYTKQSELSIIQNDINLLEKAIDVKIANGESYSTELSQLNTKKEQRATKELEITSVQNQINTIDNNINILVNSLNINNYLTQDQQDELKSFIIEEDFNDSVITARGDTYDILQELLEAGREYLTQNNTPRFSADIDVVAFNRVNDSDCQIDAENLLLGSIIKVNVDKLNVAIDAKILEIEEGFDDYSLNIKIANTLNITDGSYKIQEMLQSLNDNKNLVALNMDNWTNGGTAKNVIDNFLENAIDTSVQNIKAVDSSFELNHRGLVMTSIEDNGKYQTIVNSEGIILSDDYGEDWNIAISRGQIVGETIGGKLVIGNTGKFNKIEMYNPSNNNLDVEIGNYTSIDGVTQKRGIKISGQSFEVVGDFSPSLNYNNNILINPIVGIQVTRSDNKVQTLMNATKGFLIKKGTGSGTFPDVVFSVDSNGQGYFGGVVNAVDFQINGVSALTTAKKIKADFIDVDNLVVNQALSLAPNATISWSQVSNKPSIPTVPSYITSTKITSTTIESPKIVGGTIAVTTNITVGKKIICGSQTDYSEKGLYFNNDSYIASTSRLLDIYSSNGVKIYANNAAMEIGTRYNSPFPVNIQGTGVNISTQQASSNDITLNSSRKIILDADGYYGSIQFKTPKLGFFTTSPVSKTSISNLSSSATPEQTRQKLIDLINALQSYGLV